MIHISNEDLKRRMPVLLGFHSKVRTLPPVRTYDRSMEAGPVAPSPAAFPAIGAGLATSVQPLPLGLWECELERSEGQRQWPPGTTVSTEQETRVKGPTCETKPRPQAAGNPSSPQAWAGGQPGLCSQLLCSRRAPTGRPLWGRALPSIRRHSLVAVTSVPLAEGKA